MNQVARPRSVIMDMAERFGMEPKPFEDTLRATVVPKNSTREQFAAFLLVAKQYNLNPITREIFAFPTRAGGIQPVVSIDGWMRIINDHPQMDGMEFTDVIEQGQLVAIRCRIYRKDRSRPVEVTEYLSECRQPTDTWKKWPARMLRHKTVIQCARYAFGYSGIIDPDEMGRMLDNGTIQRPGSLSRRARMSQDAVLERFANGGETAEEAPPAAEEEPEPTPQEPELPEAAPEPSSHDEPAPEEPGIPEAYEMGRAAWHKNVNRNNWPARFKKEPKMQEAWQSGWDREEHAGGDAA